MKDGRFAGVWPSNEAFFSAMRAKGGAHWSRGGSSHRPRMREPALSRDPLARRLPQRQASGEVWLSSEGDAHRRSLAGGVASHGGVPRRKSSKATRRRRSGSRTRPSRNRGRQYVTDTAVTHTTPLRSRRPGGERHRTPTPTAEATSRAGSRSFSSSATGRSSRPFRRKGKFLLVGQSSKACNTAIPLPPRSWKCATPTCRPAGGETHAYRIIAVNTAGLESKAHQIPSTRQSPCLTPRHESRLDRSDRHRHRWWRRDGTSRGASLRRGRAKTFVFGRTLESLEEKPPPPLRSLFPWICGYVADPDSVAKALCEALTAFPPPSSTPLASQNARPLHGPRGTARIASRGRQRVMDINVIGVAEHDPRLSPNRWRKTAGHASSSFPRPRDTGSTPSPGCLTPRASGPCTGCSSRRVPNSPPMAS